ncbi:MAG TPA: hypothetical protein PK954_14615, partial [Anaerolineales bacterium]|nr:hypothetical protein [Anaerolineales bacterium]
MAPPQLPPQGLHTFKLTPPGGTVRLHLRVEADGHGLLFVDVTDVVHLNPSAAYIAWLALNGLPRERAAGALAARFGARMPIAVDQIYTMIERFGNPALGCPTCAVTPLPWKCVGGARTCRLSSRPAMAPTAWARWPPSMASPSWPSLTTRR